MVYNPERSTDNSPLPPSQYVTLKNPSARKSLGKCVDTLEVKHETTLRRFVPLKKIVK